MGLGSVHLVRNKPDQVLDIFPHLLALRALHLLHIHQMADSWMVPHKGADW